MHVAAVIRTHNHKGSPSLASLSMLLLGYYYYLFFSLFCSGAVFFPAFPFLHYIVGQTKANICKQTNRKHTPNKKEEEHKAKEKSMLILSSIESDSFFFFFRARCQPRTITLMVADAQHHMPHGCFST